MYIKIYVLNELRLFVLLTMGFFLCLHIFLSIPFVFKKIAQSIQIILCREGIVFNVFYYE